jgi:hypothetical protein
MADSLLDTYRRNAEQAERYETTASTDEEKAAWRRALKRWRELEMDALRYQRASRQPTLQRSLH